MKNFTEKEIDIIKKYSGRAWYNDQNMGRDVWDEYAALPWQERKSITSRILFVLSRHFYTDKDIVHSGCFSFFIRLPNGKKIVCTRNLQDGYARGNSFDVPGGGYDLGYDDAMILIVDLANDLMLDKIEGWSLYYD